MAGTGSADYYAVLGVSRSASAEEIRAAFLNLQAMKWHPDKLARFHHIQQAYKVLSDPTRRALYDAGLYDPTLHNDEVDEAKSMLNALGQMLPRMDKAQEELITDVEVNIVNKNKGSAVRIDVILTNDGGSTTTTTTTTVAGGASGGGSRAAGRGTGTRPRRRMCYPAPILGSRLKFAPP